MSASAAGRPAAALSAAGPGSRSIHLATSRSVIEESTEDRRPTILVKQSVDASKSVYQGFAATSGIWHPLRMAKRSPTLGERLRETRARAGLSLREVERRSGVNSGYLSQLERNEVTHPGPTVLQKVSKGYGEPFQVLMRWAGYIEDDPSGLSPNAQRALSVLGDDFTDDEVEALKAVLEVMRSKSRALFSAAHRTDLALGGDDRTLIRQHAVAVLREIDGLGSGAVDLEAVMAFADLVRTDAVELTLEEKTTLRRRFGSLVDRALNALQGVVHLDSREIYVDRSMYELRQRFVLGHEVGHAILPDHRAVFAHLDDTTRLTPEFNDLLERQANQFAIELLAKGDQLRQEFDSSRPSSSLLDRLHSTYGISLQAIARRVAEESHRPVAVAIAHRAWAGEGALMPHRLYTSAAFDARLRWQADRHRPDDLIRDAVRAASTGLRVAPIAVQDVDGRRTTIVVEALDTRYAVILLLWLAPMPSRFRWIGQHGRP